MFLTDRIRRQNTRFKLVSRYKMLQEAMGSADKSGYGVYLHGGWWFTSNVCQYAFFNTQSLTVWLESVWHLF